MGQGCCWLFSTRAKQEGRPDSKLKKHCWLMRPAALIPADALRKQWVELKRAAAFDWATPSVTSAHRTRNGITTLTVCASGSGLCHGTARKKHVAWHASPPAGASLAGAPSPSCGCPISSQEPTFAARDVNTHSMFIYLSNTPCRGAQAHPSQYLCRSHTPTGAKRKRGHMGFGVNAVRSPRTRWRQATQDRHESPHGSQPVRRPLGDGRQNRPAHGWACEQIWQRVACRIAASIAPWQPNMNAQTALWEMASGLNSKRLS